MNSKTTLGRILLTGASLAAMSAFSPAFAQDDEPTEEVVVTATGRSAALQDVPVAVTAVTAETIENTGADDLRDLTQVVPSFSMGTGQSSATGTTARIRGLGTGSDNPGFESAVGIFIDGVYRARAGAAMADLPELERVEVLRGPQGTLFGRNTSAGAISVITAGPDFAPGMSLEATAGFDDLEEVGTRAMVNAPLSESFALRVDGSVRARDGYITDLISGDDINNRDRYTARAQALWDISPDASLRVILDGAGTDEVCCGITPLAYGAAQAGIQGTFLSIGQPANALASTPAIDIEGRGMTVTPGRSYLEQTEEWGISGQLDWDIGGMNFTSITAYRDWEATRGQDIDFNLVDIAYRDGLEVGFENFTQEFRLQGETGRLNWLVGLFYGDEDLQYDDTIRIGAHASLYSNILTVANTDGQIPPAGDNFGCELYNFSGAMPSIFQCAATPLAPLNPLLLGEIASVNPGPDAGHLQVNLAGHGQAADNWDVNTQSLSLFTHNEFSFTDNLVLTVGLRYNQDSKELEANLNSVSPSCETLQDMEAATLGITLPGPTAFPGGIVSLLIANGAGGLMNLACNPAVNTIANGTHSGDAEEEEFSGTLSLAYHLSDDTMIYGGYSRGYKAGGFNTDRSGFSILPSTILTSAVSVDDLHFNPEFTDSYEVGLRTTLFGNTTFNLTGFYQQIHDYQLNAFNGFNFITENIPEAISQGVELELASRVTDNLTLAAGVTWNDAYYDSTVEFTPGSAQDTVFSGDPFAFAPELVATGSITYEMPLGGDLRALFYLDGRWNDGYRTQTLNRDPLGRTDNGETTIFNGRIGIGPQSERWSIELWGRNLFDEYYHVGAFVPPLQSNPNPALNTYVVYPNEPATYGVTLRARY
jgi:iron complex outermembrane recepter protein